MQVLIESHQRKYEVSKAIEKMIYSILETGLKYEGIDSENIEVSIVLTNNRNIKKVNKEFRNIDKKTDVLSFPQYERSELNQVVKNHSKEDGPIMIGDIMISVEKVADQAIEYGHTFQRELGYMIIHSLLHLLGYDHINDDEQKIMRAKEEKVLETLKLVR